MNGNNPYAGCPLKFPPKLKFQLEPTDFFHLASNCPNSKPCLPKLAYEPLTTNLSPIYRIQDSVSTYSSPKLLIEEYLTKYSQPLTAPLKIYQIYLFVFHQDDQL